MVRPEGDVEHYIGRNSRGPCQQLVRQAGDVDGQDTLGAHGAAVGAASLVEREPAIRGAAGQVSVDDDH